MKGNLTRSEKREEKRLKRLNSEFYAFYKECKENKDLIILIFIFLLIGSVFMTPVVEEARKGVVHIIIKR